MEKTILLIESSESERKDISGFLNSIGYTVTLAVNSNEGLRSFNELQPDLVIVEVLLSGGVNGLQVCKSIKEIAPDWAKVIVISKLYNSRAMARDAVNRYKANVYLEKPFQMADLFDHIRELIGDPPDSEKMREVMEEGTKRNSRSRTRRREPQPGKRPRSAAASGPNPIETVPPPPSPPTPQQSAPEPSPPAPVAEPDPAPEPVVAPVAEPESPPAPDEEFADQGKVDAETLGSLLHSCFQKRYNGVLILEYPEGIKHIYLVDGIPVFVQSNLPGETIGQMLEAEGHLTAEQIQEVLAEAQAAGQKFGTVCVRMGFLTSAKLQTLLTEQTAVKVAACFAWKKGTYRIDRSRHYPPGAPSFEAPPAKILWIAYGRYVDLEQIKQMVDTAANRIVFAGKEPIYKGLARLLNDEEKAFVDAADGTLSLLELVQGGQLEHDAAIRLSGCLLAMGIFKLGEVRRADNLSEYAPDPAVESDEKLDSLAMFSQGVGELALRLETEHPFDVFEIDPAGSKQDIRNKLGGLREQFDPNRLPPEASEALRQQVAAVRGRIEGACSRLEQSTPKKSSSITAEQAVERGLKVMSRNKFHRAVDFFTRAVELEPDNAQNRLLLGEAIFKGLTNPEHTLDDAVSEIEQGLSLGADGDSAFTLLAQIARYRGDTDAEKAYLERLNESDAEGGSADQDPEDWDLSGIDPDDSTDE